MMILQGFLVYFMLTANMDTLLILCTKCVFFLFLQVPSCQDCLWTAVFFCPPKSSLPQTPHPQPSLPLQRSLKLGALMEDKLQALLGQETLLPRLQ